MPRAVRLRHARCRRAPGVSKHRQAGSFALKLGYVGSDQRETETPGIALLFIINNVLTWGS